METSDSAIEDETTVETTSGGSESLPPTDDDAESGAELSAMGVDSRDAATADLAGPRSERVDEAEVVESTSGGAGGKTSFDIIREQISACEGVIFERTNAQTIPPLVRSIKLELPQLFCVVGLLTASDLDEGGLAAAVLKPAIVDEDLSESDLAGQLSERVTHYKSALTEEQGNAGNLFARRVGRIGDGLMIRIVNDSIADCKAALVGNSLGNEQA